MWGMGGGGGVHVGTLNRKMRKIFSMKSVFLLLPSGICKIFADYLTYMRKKKKTFSYSSFYSKTVFLRCMISELS